MYSIIRFFLFLLPAETAHHFAMGAFEQICSWPLTGQYIKRLFYFEHKSLERNVFGLRFKNPIGIAAGFDKDARYIRALEAMGFAFVEVGTVTPLPQKGNIKPRLFRLKRDSALINRMGFNNEGVDAMVKRLKRTSKRGIVIGGNIGKNKETSLERAHEDYLKCFLKLYKHVDYFVVNVSSPNTPGLRSLQDREPLMKILNALIKARADFEIKKPILLKISPDLNSRQLGDIISIINTIDIDGIIATNTTIDRDNLKSSAQKIESLGNGGLSGTPLSVKSNKVLELVCQGAEKRISVIGVGGISDVNTAKTKIDHGAQLIQIYTGFIYKGPFLIKKLKRGLVKNLKF